MGEKQSSRDVPDRAPANDAWAEGLGLTSGRSADGGGYGKQAMAHLAADGLVREGERRDPLTEAAGGGDLSWFARSNHASDPRGV